MVLETDFPLMCDICGELYDQGNANTAIAVVEDGKRVTKFYCASCFFEKLTEGLPDKVHEIVKEKDLI